MGKVQVTLRKKSIDYRLTTIADLYINFNQNKYKLDPCVPYLHQPDLTEASAYFSTRKRHIQISSQNWQTLFDPVPTTWRNIISLGNQTFSNNEFFATKLCDTGNKYQVGDTYEFIDGHLKYYRIDEHSNVHDAQIRRLPGTCIKGWTHSFPDLNQLKRIHVSNPRVTQSKVIGYMLPHRDALKLDNLQYRYVGAIVGSYAHDLAPGLSDEK